MSKKVRDATENKEELNPIDWDEKIKLSAVEWGRERKRLAEEQGVGVKFLDEERDTRLKKVRSNGHATVDATPPPDVEALAASAKKIIDNKNVLALFWSELEKVVVGEKENGQLLFLIGVSRLFRKPMSGAVKGTSSGGKSEVKDRVLDFFPPEEVITFTSLSEKALIFDVNYSHKILAMGEASAVDDQKFQDYLIREMISAGRIVHKSVMKVGDELVTQTIVVEGPVAFLVTTTRDALHAENETRLVSLEINDTDTQTKAVLQKVAAIEGLGDTATIINLEPWHDFQLWLKAGNRDVVVPFAMTLAKLIPPVAVRLRRDFGQILRAIKAHALLHRSHRVIDERGRIVADIRNDYDAIRVLMNDRIAFGAGVAIKLELKQTIEAVGHATKGLAQDDGANALDIAKLLKLDKTAGWRRLRGAMREQFVVNLETKRGQPGRYRLTGQVLKEVEMMPTSDRLESMYLATPPILTQPRNRTENHEENHEDSGCKPGCKPVASDAPGAPGMQPDTTGCSNRATQLATGNPLEEKAEPPPVARLHEIRGGWADTHTHTVVCEACDGLPDSLSGKGCPTCKPENWGLRPKHPAVQGQWADATAVTVSGRPQGPDLAAAMPDFLRRPKAQN